MNAAIAPEALHPELLDLDVEDFLERASPKTLRRGITWFREHRVTSVVEQDFGIEATFSEGTRSEPDATIQVWIADDELRVCGVYDQPWGDDDERWAWALAAVYAYQAKFAATGASIESAAQRAIEARRERSRQEVAFEPVTGTRVYGTYRAWSVGADRPGRDAYLVQLRSRSRRLNGCTCPDFRMSDLGMCKHTEAVRGANARRRMRATRATIARARDGRWILIMPESLVAPLREDGLLPGDLMLVPPSDFETEDGGSPERDLVFGALAPDALEARPGLVEQWLADERFDVGHDILEALESAEQVNRAKSRALRWRRWFRDWDGAIDGMRVTPFAYQQSGIAFLVERGRALLADDMGLGKTMQAIAAATLMLNAGEVEKVLVACPTTLLGQWRREIEKFTDRVAVVVEGGRAERARILRSSASFYITTYDRLRLDFDLITHDLRPELLVLDEAQRIKNWATRNAQYVDALQTRYAFVLTGTPLENKLEELYALVHVIDPAVLGPLWRFQREFAITNLTGDPVGYRNLNVLRERLASVMLRRDRKSVLDQLPARTNIDIDVGLNRPQMSVHDEAYDVAMRLASIRARRPLSPSESQRLLGALQRARMACDSAHIVDPALPWQSPKLAALAELIDELCVQEGRKVIIFSEWIRMGELAGRVAAEAGVGWVQLSGSVPSRKRAELIERFENDPSIGVFVSSDAGSTGLNLQAATALIHLDCPWNPAVLEQRTARVHRHGQTRPVQIVRLIARGAYEGHVATLVDQKQSLFDNVVGDAGQDDIQLGKPRLEHLLATLKPLSNTSSTRSAGRPSTGAEAEDGDGDLGDEAEDTRFHDSTPVDHDETETAPGVDGGDHVPSPEPDGQSARTEASGDAGVTSLDGSGDQSAHGGALVPPTDSELDRALAALDTPGLTRTDRLRAIDDLTASLPEDAELSVVDGRLLVAVSNVDDVAAAIDVSDFGPLQVDLVSHDDAPAVRNYVASRNPDAVHALDRSRIPAVRADEDAVTEPPEKSRRTAHRGEDPRTTSARILWDAGQRALAVELLAAARLDAIAALLGRRAPERDDAWRWLYAEALPAGAIDATEAGSLALALTAVANDRDDLIESTWRLLMAPDESPAA